MSSLYLRPFTGYFDETVPKFLAETPEAIALVNADCDIYSSTKTVLDALLSNGKTASGLVIYFDELINYRTHLWNEALALFELLEATGLDVEPISVHQRVRPVDETLFLLREGRFPRWQEDVDAGYRVHAAVRLVEHSELPSALPKEYVTSFVHEAAPVFVGMTAEHMPERLANFADS